MHPYSSLPEYAFWKTAVSSRSMFDIQGLWKPKFIVASDDKIVSFGSCFAQHIGKALEERGFRWLITEKAPAGLSLESRKTYGYDLFSARTGNIYTTSALNQWVKWALNRSETPTEVWERNGRYYDPFRPRLEPGGFVSEGEVRFAQEETLNAVKSAIKQADIFVFTLGLTESWVNTQTGQEYPLCPGTAAGEFDSSVHSFVNLDFLTVREQLAAAIHAMREENENLRFLLTVSPVPLTASNSGQHVLVSTNYSKAVLRAVAGELSQEYDFIDYFPSYEIVTSPVFRGAFFEPNLREVNPRGVRFVMEHFFAGIEGDHSLSIRQTPEQPASENETEPSDVVCDEAILEAFSG